MTIEQRWPRLSRTGAIARHHTVATLSPRQARQACGASTTDDAPAPGNEASIRRLVDALRATADLHGWPNAIGRTRAEQVDRAWSHVLIREVDVTPVEAAEEGLWSFLALIELPDLVRWRFPEAGSERYIGLVDHAFGRLWWRTRVLGEDIIDGLGDDPLTEDELVALFRRRDLVASARIARAIATEILDSGPADHARLTLIKQVGLGLLRLTPMIELDALDDAELLQLVGRVRASAESARS